MSEAYSYERIGQSFWRDVGLDSEAAWWAIRCFPEFHNSTYMRGPYQNEYYTNYFNSFVEKAIAEAERAPLAYRSDARHPAFWLLQGCNCNETARRAVAAYGGHETVAYCGKLRAAANAALNVTNQDM